MELGACVLFAANLSMRLMKFSLALLKIQKNILRKIAVSCNILSKFILPGEWKPEKGKKLQLAFEKQVKNDQNLTSSQDSDTCDQSNKEAQKSTAILLHPPTLQGLTDTSRHPSQHVAQSLPCIPLPHVPKS